MEKLTALLVVEGKTDKALIESFLDADIITTNGSEVSRETIDFIKEAAKKRSVIVLTDPDSPGKRIRDVLDGNIKGLLHAYIPKEGSVKHHKVGVAESSKTLILEALSHVVPSNSRPDASLTFQDFMDLGLASSSSSSERREKIGKELHLGFGNAKTLLKRANALGLTKEDLKKALNG